MSQTEYEGMLGTDTVQESHLTITNVALPENPMAFIKQADVGSLYVRFDVPGSSVISKGGGWGFIPGPNSVWARAAALKGLPIPQMPTATNIIHAVTKIR